MSKRAKVWDVLYPVISFLIIMVIATMIVTMVCSAVTGEYDLNSPKLKAMPLLVNILYYGITLIYQRTYFRQDEERFFHDERKIRPSVLVLTLVFAVCASELAVALIYGLKIPEIFSRYGELASQSFEGQNIFLLIAASVIFAPLAEELIFRGMMYRRCRSYLGTAAATVLSALAFGVYHFNVVQFLYAFAMGLIFAYFYEKTHTLIVPVLCHAAANAAEIFRDRAGWSFESGISVPAVAAEAVAALLCLYLLARIWKNAENRG